MHLVLTEDVRATRAHLTATQVGPDVTGYSVRFREAWWDEARAWVGVQPVHVSYFFGNRLP